MASFFRLSKPAFVSKATGNASKHHPFKTKIKGRILKKLVDFLFLMNTILLKWLFSPSKTILFVLFRFSKSSAVMKYAKGSTAGTSVQTKNQWKITKKL